MTLANCLVHLTCNFVHSIDNSETYSPHKHTRMQNFPIMFVPKISPRMYADQAGIVGCGCFTLSVVVAVQSYTGH